MILRESPLQHRLWVVECLRSFVGSGVEEARWVKEWQRTMTLDEAMEKARGQRGTPLGRHHAYRVRNTRTAQVIVIP